MINTMTANGGRRPYRVVFEDVDDHGVARRSTIVARDREQAHREAKTIARGGRRAEVHYIAHDGAGTCLEVHEP